MVEEARRKAEGEKFAQEAAARRAAEEKIWQDEFAQNRDREEQRYHADMMVRRGQEEERWIAEVAERRQREDADFAMAEEARRKVEGEQFAQETIVRRTAEEQKWQEQFAEHRRLKEMEFEAEVAASSSIDAAPIKKVSCGGPLSLSGADGLKVVIAARKIQMFHHGIELTRDEGIRSIFLKEGQPFVSAAAVWRVRKMDETRIVCFLRWAQEPVFFQAWQFTRDENGGISFEVAMRSRHRALSENERVEFCLRTGSGTVGGGFNSKANAFYCGDSAGIKIETLNDDKICGIVSESEGHSTPYFLTVRDSSPENIPGTGYFKGRFCINSTPMSARHIEPVACKIALGKLAFNFDEGRGDIFWNNTRLTTGFGLYTSIYSKGVWYDSTQAKWSVESLTRNKITVKGCWPWIPVTQTWTVLLEDSGSLKVDILMNAGKQFPARLKETVLMLSDRYQCWQADQEPTPFPREFTGDDFFRVCPWSGVADGVTAIASVSDAMPSVILRPSRMEGYRLVVENAAHVGGSPARLFHCLSTDNNDAVCSPGESLYFMGAVNITEDRMSGLG
jgi:hypothetical protein